jgi:hypothetical protein
MPEQFKPGRYAEYYDHGPGAKVPYSFLSMDEERSRGSTPGGFLSKWMTRKGVSQSTIDPAVPQVHLIPPEDFAEHVKQQFDLVGTPEQRAQIDAAGGLKKVIIDMLRNHLAAADWAEQTHGIKIEVHPDLLKWVKEAKG